MSTFISIPVFPATNSPFAAYVRARQRFFSCNIATKKSKLSVRTLCIPLWLQNDCRGVPCYSKLPDTTATSTITIRFGLLFSGMFFTFASYTYILPLDYKDTCVNLRNMYCTRSCRYPNCVSLTEVFTYLYLLY